MRIDVQLRFNPSPSPFRHGHCMSLPTSMHMFIALHGVMFFAPGSRRTTQYPQERPPVGASGTHHEASSRAICHQLKQPRLGLPRDCHQLGPEPQKRPRYLDSPPQLRIQSSRGCDQGVASCQHQSGCGFCFTHLHLRQSLPDLQHQCRALLFAFAQFAIQAPHFGHMSVGARCASAIDDT